MKCPRPPRLHFRCPRFSSAWQENRQKSKESARMWTEKNMESFPTALWEAFISLMLQGEGRSERVEDSLAFSFSFVLPPTEEHWYWRLSGARSLFSHALAALTVMKRTATVGKINNSAWIFSPNLPLQPECPFFPPPRIPLLSSPPPPLDSLCSSSPSLTLVLLLFFCHARFNSVTYGVLRGTSACLTCRFGSAWLPVSVFPGTDLVFFFCDGEFILFYLRLPSLSELHQCRTFPRLCRELFFSASVKMLFVDCMKFPLDSLWLKSAIQCTARVIWLWTLTKWDQWAGSINEAHSGAGS